MRTTIGMLAVGCFILGSAVGARSARAMEPLQIQIQVQVVEVTKADADALSQNEPDGIPAKGRVLDLVKSGKAQVVCAPSLITQNGMEARIKAVEEFVFPKSWTIVAPADTAAPAEVKTREVGLKLACLPEVSPDGAAMRIALTLELGEPPVWKTYRAKSVTPDGKAIDLEIEQPVFHDRVLTAQITARNGETVMAGGGIPNRNGDKIAYLLLTARLVDAAGNARVIE